MGSFCWEEVWGLTNKSQFIISGYLTSQHSKTNSVSKKDYQINCKFETNPIDENEGFSKDILRIGDILKLFLFFDAEKQIRALDMLGNHDSATAAHSQPDPKAEYLCKTVVAACALTSPGKHRGKCAAASVTIAGESTPLPTTLLSQYVWNINL